MNCVRSATPSSTRRHATRTSPPICSGRSRARSIACCRRGQSRRSRRHKRRLVARPALEVADIFRDHGAAWRDANRGHVSLDQLKVMTAIERCRTAALGGHVERCEDCGHTLIAYNSCRNRHCPKCQGAGRAAWLEEREAELLPVPYFHVVFTLPAEIGEIAYQNKARDLRPPLQRRGRDPAHHRRRPEAPGRRDRHHRGAAYLGLSHDHHPHVH